MFNPNKPDSILDIQAEDLLRLPAEEDDWHEYKSGSTRDKELGKKISSAASGFWNSGGGLFVAGVDGDGKPDGGISMNVGRQSRRDWIDQQIAKVIPQGFYVVKKIEDKDNDLNIESDSAIFLVAFGESEIGPHMAHDHCYYIRSGAHPVPASHFIVESIHARRGFRNPMLRNVVCRKPGNSSVIQLGIISLGVVPAIDVSIELDPSPKLLESWSANNFPIRVPIISEKFPFFFDVAITYLEGFNSCFDVKLTYSDIANHKYEQILKVDIESQLGPNLTGDKGYEKLEKGLAEIEKTIKGNLGEIKKAVAEVSRTIKNKK